MLGNNRTAKSGQSEVRPVSFGLRVIIKIKPSERKDSIGLMTNQYCCKTTISISNCCRIKMS